MTKRNAIALFSLLAAGGLQAARIPNGPAMDEALALVRQGRNPLAASAQVVPQGWGSYLAQKASNAPGAMWEGLKATPGAISSGWEYGKAIPYAGAPLRAAGWAGNTGYDLTGRGLSNAAEYAKATPGAIGSGINAGWEYGKGIPYAGAALRGLGNASSTAAGYAANPYIAQSIANRLPSNASFIKDYPTTANAAALAATVGAGYGLKQLYNRYYQTLDDQITNALAQELKLDEQLNGKAQYSQKGLFLGYPGGLYDQLQSIPSDQKDKLKKLQAQIEFIENNLAIVHAQLDDLFAQKIKELSAKMPGQTLTQRLHLLLNRAQDPAKITQFGLPEYINNPRFIRAVENSIASCQFAPATLDQRIQELAVRKQQIENELYHGYKQASIQGQAVNKAVYLNDLEQKAKDINQQLTDLLAEQKNAQPRGWFRR